MTVTSPRAARTGWRYRVNIGARALAGTLGAYAVAALFAAAVARAWPASRVEATTVATLLAYLVTPGVTVWAFLARSPARAWIGIAGLVIALAIIALVAGSPA